MQIALPAAFRIVGYVIVSSDGMLADAKGDMPPSIHNKADQDFFHGGLDQAAAIVHGRNSKERDAKAKDRKRLMMTRAVSATAPDPKNPKARLWNPTGASLADALRELGVTSGTIAVIGGTEVFGMFLPHYDMFHLTTAANARLPGGRPVFPGIPPATPEELLSQNGMSAGERQMLDQAAAVSLVTWIRKPNR